jgi:hypothetical protein
MTKVYKQFNNLFIFFPPLFDCLNLFEFVFSIDGLQITAIFSQFFEIYLFIASFCG